MTLIAISLDRITSTSLSMVDVSALRSDIAPSTLAMLLRRGSIWTVADAS